MSTKSTKKTKTTTAFQNISFEKNHTDKGCIRRKYENNKKQELMNRQFINSNQLTYTIENKTRNHGRNNANLSIKLANN
jgi:hypothetical protein